MIRPPVDLHAHIDPGIDPQELTALEATIFAVTRTLDEADIAVTRPSERTVWGVGIHPKLAKAHKQFNPARFRELISRTCFVGEIGLDGTGRFSLERQLPTFHDLLQVLADTPRITSIHSAGATKEVLDALERTSIQGAVLHWWLGSRVETNRAVDLGCYFSLNPACTKRKEIMQSIPLDRVLTETDHPFGDRRSDPQRPGNVDRIESALARAHGMSRESLRRQVWQNLAKLVADTGCGTLIPRALRPLLASV